MISKGYTINTIQVFLFFTVWKPTILVLFHFFGTASNGLPNKIFILLDAWRIKFVALLL